MVLEYFVNFSYMTIGRLIYAAAALLCMLIIAGVMARRGRFSAKMLTYAAICIALATALSFVKVFEAPFGGSVTLCSMVFIVLTGYWFGPGVGLLAGITMGLIQFVIDPYIIHPVQMFLDYPIAFGMLGLAGLFQKKKFGLYAGVLVGCAGRCAMSTLSGVIFFAEYAPPTMHPLIYSVLYNGSYIGAEMIITMVIITVPVIRSAIQIVQKQAISAA